MATWISITLLILSGLLLVTRHETAAATGLYTTDIATLMAGLAVVVFLVARFFQSDEGDQRSPLVDAVPLRKLAVWGMGALIAGGLILNREAIFASAERVVAELSETTLSGQNLAADAMPMDNITARDATTAKHARPSAYASINAAATQARSGPVTRHALRVRADAQGQFHVNARIGSTPVRMLFDTGASRIVLSYDDARRMGLAVDTLRYGTPLTTANGTAYGASVRLRHIFVGPIQAHDVEAMVASPGALEQSLLGQSFLSRLSSIGFGGGFLVLQS